MNGNAKKRTWKRWPLIAGGIVAVAILLVSALQPVLRDRQPITEDGQGETVTAFIGDLSANATASGKVRSSRTASLAVDRPGIVEEIFVRVGDSVSTGDQLVQLETNDLALNVAIAEQDLKLKEAGLADLLAEPSAAEIAAAEAAVTSALAQLDDLLDGPSAEEIAAREADLEASEANVLSSSAQLNQAQNAVTAAEIAAAEAALAAAEAALKSVEIQYTRNPDPSDIRANTALAQAREQLVSAQARLDALLAGPDQNRVGSAQASLSATSAQRDAAEAQLNKLTSDPSAAEVASLEAQLAQAQASLAALLRGPMAEQIAASEAEIEQARIALTDAQAALAAATITAPFDGMVTTVRVSEGELASGPVVELVDRNSLEIILEVDEVDIGFLTVGQPAVITLEAWPEFELLGEIAAIAPSSTTLPGSSLVIYEVHLDLGVSDLPVLIGMTANANLVTAEKEDILLLPNRAINADRSTGTYSVNAIVGGEVAEIPVTIGLRDNRYTQVTSGLSAGDEVLVGSSSPVVDFSQQGGPFGGG